MLVTADVSQAPMGRSKDQAQENSLLMSITADVFHDPMSSLK